jgi:RNA polymerase sigma factor (sigma-70 family)
MTGASDHNANRPAGTGGWIEAGGKAEQRLKEAFDAARREYGSIPLSFELFARRVLERMDRRLRRCGVEPSADRLDHLTAASPLTDLFLAIACEEDAPGAWETFTERFVPRLKRLARHRGFPDREAVPAAEALPGELIFRPGGGKNRSRLGTYEGAGRLFDWLAVIFIRRLPALSRGAGLPRGASGLSLDAPRNPGGKGLAEEVPGRSVESSEPLVQMIEQETCKKLADALRAGWRELTSSESLALLYKYEQQLHQKEIARLLGLSESRISRIVKKAIHKIREHVLRSVPEAPSVVHERPDRFWPVLQAVEARLHEASSQSFDRRTPDQGAMS